MINDTSSQKRPKCLLVDDLSENLVALNAILKEEPVEVFMAKSGEEALNLMIDHDFAVALLDVQMPSMDGLELAEIMRSTDRTRSIPIIFVTSAVSGAQRIFRGYEAGAVDFLQKPLSPQVVVSKVRVFIELYNQKSELEQKVNELRMTEARLQKALQSRDEFLSICSHELKTPLTTLKMQLQIVDRIRSKQGDEVAFAKEKMERFINQSEKSVDRIVHLVNDMLDISRVHTGRLSLNLESVNVADLTKEVLERLAPIMEMANCQIHFEATGQGISRIDRFRIEQVLANILTNAAKYASDRPVDVRVDHQSESVEILIQDHGEGISHEDQKRIFERFQRAVDHQCVSGLGLGLFISKEIVQMHKGSISVESEIGKGSCFKVVLPRENSVH